MVRVFIPKETGPGETRVGATPETVKKMIAAGLEVVVQAGAGEASHIADGNYEEVGAQVSGDGGAEELPDIGPETGRPLQRFAFLASSAESVGEFWLR